MKKCLSIFKLYTNFPKFVFYLLPIIIMENFVTAFGLNISLYFTKVDHLHFREVGSLISVFYIGFFIGAVAAGPLTLNKNPVRMISHGLFAQSLILAALLVTSELFMLKLCMLLLGLTASCISVNALAAMVRVSKAEGNGKLRSVGLEFIIYNLSFSLSAMILFALEANTIKWFMLFVSLIEFCVGIFALWLSRSNLFEAYKSESYSGLKCYFPEQDRIGFFILVLIVLLSGIIFSIVKVLYIPSLEIRFGDTMLAGLIASINPWLIFALQLLIVDKIKSTNSYLVIGLGMMIVGASYFSFGLTNSFYVTVLSLMILTVGEMMFAPLSKHKLIQFFGKGKEGHGYSIWKMAFLSGGIIGPRIGGELVEQYGNSALWEACLILGIFCFLLSSIKHMVRKVEYNHGLNQKYWSK